MRHISASIGAIAVLGAALAGACPVSVWAGEAVAGVVTDTTGNPMYLSKSEIEKLLSSGKVSRGQLSQKAWKEVFPEKELRRMAAKVKRKTFLHEGDVIFTWGSDRTAIAFLGGIEIRVNNDSEYRVESGGSGGGNRPVSLYTRLGQAWTRAIGKGGGGDRVRIRTPLAVAAVRGTKADVNMRARLDVKVYEGTVDLGNKYGSQTLGAGMMASVAGPGVAPSQARKMTDAERLRWQEGLTPKEVEKRLDQLRKRAEQERKVKLKYMKDGKPQELNLDLEKK